MSGDPNAVPESLELQLLLSIRDELRAEREESGRWRRAMRADLDGVIAAQRQLGLAMGLELVIPAPRPTPPPALAESWAPEAVDSVR